MQKSGESGSGRGTTRAAPDVGQQAAAYRTQQAHASGQSRSSTQQQRELFNTQTAPNQHDNVRPLEISAAATPPLPTSSASSSKNKKKSRKR